MRSMDLDLADLLEEYRAEAAEHLRALDAHLLHLEHNPSDPASIREMFLSAHTIKGAAALLQLGATTYLAHAMEDVLAWLRDSRETAGREIVDLLFQAVDRLRLQVQRSMPGDTSPDEATEALAQALRHRASSGQASGQSTGDTKDALARRALVVENSATVRRLEAMLLAEAGFEVDVAAGGNEALDMALSRPYQFVVASMETRGLRGLDLANILRSQPFYRTIPIVLMSSDDNPEHRRQAAEVGVQAYIRKGALGDRRLLETARDLMAQRQTPDVTEQPSGMKVLIADDDAVARRLMEQAVRACGHETTVARDGVQAWELYEGDRFDVVISDWTMPGMDGMELCRRVRGAGAAHGYTYFIFATSLSDRQHFSTAMASGADDYLTKPFDPLDLRARLTVARRVTALYHRVMQDSVDLQRLNQELFEQSRVDPLTQLGNRLRLTEDLKLLDGRVQRYWHTYAIAILDVDHFKRYNDRYGHPEGDEVLRAVARTLRESSRQGDAVYRYG
ncbi:MAG: response regulator, partial [Chloroflexi bacterium]|nr:response regulator [Chloroflexota bacterium]